MQLAIKIYLVYSDFLQFRKYPLFWVSFRDELVIKQAKESLFLHLAIGCIPDIRQKPNTVFSIRLANKYLAKYPARYRLFGFWQTGCRVLCLAGYPVRRRQLVKTLFLLLEYNRTRKKNFHQRKITKRKILDGLSCETIPKILVKNFLDGEQNHYFLQGKVL